MEKITKGTILRNMYQPQYESYLIILDFQDRFANCIWVVNTGKEITIKYNAHFYRHSIKNDREHYPIAGYLDLDNILINHTLNEARGYAKRAKNNG